MRVLEEPPGGRGERPWRDVTMADFERDPNDWLRKRAPREWVQAGLAELRRAEAAFESRDVGAGLLGCKRAAGMALNGALLVEPNPAWGRSYVEHVKALVEDVRVPLAVRESGRLILDERPPNPHLLTLRVPRAHERVIEATRDVMAHALAVVIRNEAG